MRFRSCLIAMILATFTSFAYAGTVTLSWTPPTQCTDGTAAATNCPITAYDLERSTSATGTFTSVATINPSVSTFTYTAPPGTWYFRLIAVSTVNSVTQRSAPSNVTSKTVGGSIPNPPSGLAAD